MKSPIIPVSFAAVSVVLSGYASAGSYEQHFGGQKGVNAHFQGSINDTQDFDRHLQGSINDDRKRIGAVEQEAANNTAWNDRQEGVIRQNRGRLDENDALNQRQNDSIDNAHARIDGVKQQADADRAVIDGNQKAIGFLQETDAQLSGAIAETNNQLAVTDKRSINNAERLDGAEGAVRETNAQVTEDRNASVQRDKSLASESGRIESESISRDQSLQGQVDYQAAINHAYRQQSAEQFARVDAAIADERNARQEADKDLQAGIAGAVAAGSHMMDVNYQGLQMSIAGGSYRGASAASLAVGGEVSSKTFMHINVTHDSRGHQAVGGNVNFKF